MTDPTIEDRLTTLETEFTQFNEQITTRPENQNRVRRYQELVDKLFLNTITPDEESEMQRLSTELETETSLFYAPIKMRAEVLAKL